MRRGELRMRRRRRRAAEWGQRGRKVLHHPQQSIQLISSDKRDQSASRQRSDNRKHWSLCPVLCMSVASTKGGPQPFLMNSSIDTSHYAHLTDFKVVLHRYLCIKGDNVITFSLFMSVCICTSSTWIGRSQLFSLLAITFSNWLLIYYFCCSHIQTKSCWFALWT